MNSGYEESLDKNFSRAYNLCTGNFSCEELFGLLKNGNMPEKQFVLVHQDGGYFSVNDGSHWIRVADPLAATILSQTKANNILTNMIKPKERNGWSVQPWQPPDTALEQSRKKSQAKDALYAQAEAEQKENEPS